MRGLRRFGVVSAGEAAGEGVGVGGNVFTEGVEGHHAPLPEAKKDFAKEDSPAAVVD